MREAWGARGVPGHRPPQLVLRRGLIHHTVNSNTYSRSQVPSMLRSIQAYHQDTRGWADIAYNFVVDRFGTIWEARARSYEDPVIGSASSGDETGDVTVAFLGDGSTCTPSSTVLRSMGRLLGWKLRKHDLTPTRANIMGHRYIGQTSCPGTPCTPGSTPSKTWPSWPRALHRRAVDQLAGPSHRLGGPPPHRPALWRRPLPARRTPLGRTPPSGSGASPALPPAHPSRTPMSPTTPPTPRPSSGVTARVSCGGSPPLASARVGT